MNTTTPPLVSIITPLYNCEDIIRETIGSVLAQTYPHWELIIVDDVSTDNSREVVKEYVAKDKRIKLIELSENGGAAIARNKGIEVAEGRFIAFLDSDDLWKETKLEKQVNFMLENDYAFTCTDYEQLVDDTKKIKLIIKARVKADYRIVIRYNPIGNSTVMYDTLKMGKVHIPEVRKRNDYALWLKILRMEKYVYGINEVLATYRIRKKSLSRNKVKLIKHQWYVYRKLEKINFFKSLYILWFVIITKIFRIK
ncbi:MAG TPA: glycosyltransferase family 2 protein [Bacilli bacterium]|nr:glycosyltransferase family 2 protein [Bacilli bacterium]HPK28456.1 glycosyltransferase family 2 protein [Bacilli bacterium]